MNQCSFGARISTYKYQVWQSRLTENLILLFFIATTCFCLWRHLHQRMVSVQVKAARKCSKGSHLYNFHNTAMKNIQKYNEHVTNSFIFKETLHSHVSISKNLVVDTINDTNWNSKSSLTYDIFSDTWFKK